MSTFDQLKVQNYKSIFRHKQARRTSSKYLPYLPPAQKVEKRRATMRPSIFTRASIFNRQRMETIEQPKVLEVKFVRIEEIKEVIEDEKEDDELEKPQNDQQSHNSNQQVPSITEKKYYNDALEIALNDGFHKEEIELVPPQTRQKSYRQFRFQITNFSTNQQQKTQCLGLLNVSDTIIVKICKIFWLIPILPFVLLYFIYTNIIKPCYQSLSKFLETSCNTCNDRLRTYCDELMQIMQWICRNLNNCFQSLFCICQPFYKFLYKYCGLCYRKLKKFFKKICDLMFECMYLIFSCFRAIFETIDQVVGSWFIYIYNRILIPFCKSIISCITFILSSIQKTLVSIGLILRHICDAFTWLFSQICRLLKPCFGLIWNGTKFVFKWTYKLIIKPIFQIINFFVTYLCKGLKIFFKIIFKIFKTLFKYIKKICQFTYKYLIEPVYNLSKQIFIMLGKALLIFVGFVWKFVQPIIFMFKLIAEEIYYGIGCLFGVIRPYEPEPEPEE